MAHPPLLELAGVTVRFGTIVALEDVTFSVPHGGITALIGPNGAGKTTCFNVISGLQPVTAGHVRFGGRDLTRIPAHQRRGMGRTFQIVQVFGEMTVRENVIVGMHAMLRGGLVAAALRLPFIRHQEQKALARASELLGLVGLAHLADRQARTLPLGQQRLLELARALGAEPKLVLLDEAASGLSPAEMETMITHVEQLRRDGRTVLLVEHNMRFVNRLADHLIVLDYGRVIYEGTVETGIHDPMVISAYLGAAPAHA